jgi:type I restriction enzyme M protein
MMSNVHGPKAIEKVKRDLYGFDTNPTIWALATLNMFFRGDGKSNIENKSCLDIESKDKVADSFQKAFLNPPFSQQEEPERDFIDASMSALAPEGLIAVVVKAGIFADDDNKSWRREFTRNHSVLAMISLPDDLFYPTAAPTSILIAKAHIPQNDKDKVLMARIANDGYEKLKGRRIEINGSQLPITAKAFNAVIKNEEVKAENATTTSARFILNGGEWSPQEWLPQPIETEEKLKSYEDDIRLSIYRAVTAIPDLADTVIRDFGSQWKKLPDYPVGETLPVSIFFDVQNGKSSGEKNYIEGEIPYVSSGDSTNSIIRLIDYDTDELFEDGAITVTAFGQAYVQPWKFMARGNGGSSVRVLIPKYKMSFNDLVWFASQINAQKWRFYYARMAIKSRLIRLEITSPPKKINDSGKTIFERIQEFRNSLINLSGAS